MGPGGVGAKVTHFPPHPGVLKRHRILYSFSEASHTFSPCSFYLKTKPSTSFRTIFEHIPPLYSLRLRFL